MVSDTLRQPLTAMLSSATATVVETGDATLWKHYAHRLLDDETEQEEGWSEQVDQLFSEWGEELEF